MRFDTEFDAAAFVLSMLAALVACGPSVPEWCSTGTDGAVAVVDQPTAWESAPEMELAWRIDGSADGRELVFPVSVAIEPEARRVAVIDFELREIVAMSLDGEWIGRWGRRGKGPGEIAVPVAAAWQPGHRLQVYDAASSKLVVFDMTGAVVSEHAVNSRFTAALGGGVTWIALGADGSLLAQPIENPRGGATELDFVILKAHVSGSTVDTLVKSPVPVVTVPGWMPFRAPGWAVPHAAVSPTGTLALAGDVADYRITIFTPDSNQHRICRTIAAQPLRPEESAPQSNADPAMRSAFQNAARPTHPAAVSRVAFDAVGRLWVHRDRPNALDPADMAWGVEGGLFDVYRADEYLGELRMPPRTRLLGATEELVLGLERDDLDVYSLVAYWPQW